MVEKQRSFFMYGPGHKKPMQLSDYADELGLHVSTISRALGNKYFQCSWGIYPMNFFLSAPALSYEGDESISRDEVITKMREIIDGEDKKKPLSDQKIAEKLTEHGMDISRRTVSKYRGLCGIPDKSGRKKH